ncbi:condensation domain-containing protein [Amycolatopsis sacchari]|uniref:condensation domain-containing protein n=1 Tax=Amycolatopsis sacchari TaxID=115433 RepID=UPI003D72AAFB
MTAVSPRTPHEEAVAAIWREVLGRPDVGVLDDFFALDGTSLQAMHVVARIRETWGVDIRARDFFESPTVATLASVLAPSAPPERPALTPRPPDAAPVLSYDQQRLWLEDQLRPGAAYHVHGRRRLTGPLDLGVLERSVRAIVARHESLRTRFPLVDGEPAQVVDEPDEHWRVEFAEAREPADATRLADEQATRPFDLAHGPLFRCLVVRLGPADHVLAVTAHHIVCDNWSIGLFIEEFAKLYEAGGEAADLPELAVQYRDYAVWQRQWLTGAALDAQVGYWRQHLAGAPAALTLPVSRRRPAPAAGGRLGAELSEEDTKALSSLCRAYRVTPFMTVMATLAAVLGRWAGQSDVVLGVPISGRADPAAEKLIGFFVNTLPLRIDLSGDPTFAELLTRVRRTALAGYAHADAPFDLLVSKLDVPRDPARTPLFQVLVNAAGGLGHVRLSGITAEELPGPPQPAKLDLALTVRETGGACRLELEYDAGRYQAALMSSLLGQVRVLLRAAAGDPARGVRDYPLREG